MAFRQVLIFIIGITLSKAALPDCLSPLRIINASDQHSAYDKWPAFINHIYELRADHLRKCPEGKVILLINGDFSGLSKWASHDEGDLNYFVLALLSADFEIVVNVGNHEGFDWEGEYGNQLFYRQSHFLQQQISKIQQKPFHTISANLKTTTRGQAVIRPYRDIEFGNGHRIRFVGLALENFFQKTDYGKNYEPQIFTGQITEIAKTAEEELARAAADKVEVVSFAIHDGLVNVKEVMRNIAEIQARKYPQVKLGPVFAAHDHRPDHDSTMGVRIFDGGERFSFVRTDVTASGETVDFELIAAKEDDGRVFDHPKAREVLQLVRGRINSIKPHHEKILTHLPQPILFDRKQLQSMRHPLGNAVSESLIDWGKRQLELHGKGNVVVVVFFNSSSYRLETMIPAGPLRAGTLWDIYPHQSKPRIGLVTGRQLKRLFASLRRHREREADPRRRYTPQMSNNLVEHSFLNLHYRNGHGPEEIPNDKTYALVLDGWLAKNGYEIPEWFEVFESVVWLDTGEQRQIEVLEGYLPDHLHQFAVNPCRYEIATQAY